MLFVLRRYLGGIVVLYVALFCATFIVSGLSTVYADAPITIIDTGSEGAQGGLSAGDCGCGGPSADAAVCGGPAVDAGPGDAGDGGADGGDG